MKTSPLLLALSVAAMALAGCTDETTVAKSPTAVAGCVGETCGDISLQKGKGAVSGLVIDDRYRPVAESRVLLLPLGLDTVTNENGEFGFVGLDPGTYTIKAQKAKHEAAPKRVDVIAGQFAEAILEARRTISDDSVILTQEYSVFVPCQINTPPAAVNVGLCGGDLTGETDRFGFRSDYSETRNVTYMVTEMLANQEAERSGAYKVVLRKTSNSGNYYVNCGITEGRYVRIVMQVAVVNEDCDVENRNNIWENDEAFNTQLWTQGMLKEYPLCPLSGCDNRGVGLRLGVKGQFVQSVFIGEPIVDMTTYAVLS